MGCRLAVFHVSHYVEAGVSPKDWAGRGEAGGVAGDLVMCEIFK